MTVVTVDVACEVKPDMLLMLDIDDVAAGRAAPRPGMEREGSLIDAAGPAMRGKNGPAATNATDRAEGTRCDLPQPVERIDGHDIAPGECFAAKLSIGPIGSTAFLTLERPGGDARRLPGTGFTFARAPVGDAVSVRRIGRVARNGR